MRSIKFRAWDGKKWVYGSLIRHTNEYVKKGYSISIAPDCPPNEITLTNKNRIDICAIHCESGTEGQYTGLKDKNGKEIYDGDKLQWDEDCPVHEEIETIITEVIFATNYAMFRLNGVGPLHAIVEKYNVEIIGNIHENPELLDG